MGRFILLLGILFSLEGGAEAQSPGVECRQRARGEPYRSQKHEVLYGDALEAQVRMVKASPEFSDAVTPYSKVLGWYAEAQGETVCVIGLFESSWGVRFVQDATVQKGRVYAHSLRPSQDWVKVTAGKVWGLTTFYVRLGPAEAVERVKKSSSVASVLHGTRVIDAIAEVVDDSATSRRWRFAFYLEKTDRRRAILIVDGFGSKGVDEGRYTDGYGFGNAAKASWDIPLTLSDWVQGLVVSRGWTNVTNLK